jgi:hypothetical protein
VIRCQFFARRAELTTNLLALYATRTASDVERGCAWYLAARTIVRSWSTHYGYSANTVACVIAALSPQCDWPRNLIIADDMLAQRAPSVGGALPANITKARRLRDTDSDSGPVGPRMLREFPQGPKVYHFAANLAGNTDVVTIDAHCLQAALADPTATTKLRWTPYCVFAECYAHAAQESGLLPCDFQSVIWHIWKRQYPRILKRELRRTW